MILGLGTDIVKVERIEKTLSRFGARFTNRCFSQSESAGMNGRRLAKRFAAKEACAKALGTGFRGGLLFKEIEVVNDASGAPSLILHGAAQKRLLSITPPGKTARLHLSLSDERDQALAVVVIDAD